MLSRDQFLSAPALQREAVDVPRLGGQVYVQELTHEEFATWAADTTTGGEGKARKYDPLYGPKLLTRCLVDEQGERLFTDADAQALGKLPAAIITPLIDVAQRLNGFGKAAIEETEKNFASG